MHEIEATYSPEDNKIRLYTVTRLDSGIYEQVRAAGFRWAPKQELFVAPAWTPARADLAEQLAGTIRDEDQSLVDRAEIRAERFEEYSDKRALDADRAASEAESLAEGIPFGQPILVGHHSEKRARKDAERINKATERAVKMWDTSQYWTTRAAGAIRAAKYKERPDVRARRIKKLEAERRKQDRRQKEAEEIKSAWSDLEIVRSKTTGKRIEPRQFAMFICNYLDRFSSYCFTLDKYPRELPTSTYEGPQSLWGALEDFIITAAEAREISLHNQKRVLASAARWIAHLDNRLAYEKAMLDNEGAGHLLEKPTRPKPPPILNYKAPDGIRVENRYNAGSFSVYPQEEMTAAEYRKINKDYKGTALIKEGAPHRIRVAMTGTVMNRGLVAVFIKGSKEHKNPEVAASE